MIESSFTGHCRNCGTTTYAQSLCDDCDNEEIQMTYYFCSHPNCKTNLQTISQNPEYPAKNKWIYDVENSQWLCPIHAYSSKFKKVENNLQERPK